MQSFTHLHLHSQYSLLDGAIQLSKLFPRLNELKMDAVALTDHGNMFGAVDFYKQAKANGIKPILGCEVYVTDKDMADRSDRQAYHFILLAKDLAGYKNLCYLVSKAYMEGFYYHPRIDHDLLKAHAGGLIGMSACLGGEVAHSLLRKGSDAAVNKIRTYQSMFDDGDFYLEVQANGLAAQDELNEFLGKAAATHNIPLVATNDCHYLEQKDARAHDCLLCIQMGKLVSDSNRMKHDVDEYYLKSTAQMEAQLGWLPQALENTSNIAERCNVDFEFGKVYLPTIAPPKSLTLEQHFREISEQGLRDRFEDIRRVAGDIDEPVYWNRLEHEMSVIESMGFVSYFLIVWDFIRFARREGIPVGPGRGSGAGSIVAYSLGITDVDPIHYDLLFERFLNPERVSMPDFDIDFCMDRRDEVIDYVIDNYGRDNVGQIVTMHQLKSRGVIRDVARVMGFPYAEADIVAKLIPEAIQGRTVSIEDALEQEPRLAEMRDKDPRVADLLHIADRLEGLNRHAGMHAAGLVIGDKPLWEYVPCSRGPNGELVTQFAKNEVEEVGLVKFDFLGLKTLTVLSRAEKLVKKDRPGFSLALLTTDDEPTYEMIRKGDTTGVFQLESSGFKELLKQLKPDCFGDIVAALALYRPGPLEGGMVDDFIDRKHGRKEVRYIHPWLGDILKETYGVIVYQEQVMQIASSLAGYSLGQADLLRRAMGKKKASEMAKQRETFLTGAREKEVDENIAEQVFDLMAKFAGYGFNKSHTVAYALISFQTAYLRCHHPEEFWAAALSCEKDNPDNLIRYINSVREMGIEVARPDVNESEGDFTVAIRDEKKRIRFGLGAVRNVGASAVEAILEARSDSKITDLFSFFESVDLRRVNKRVAEALVKSGSFDDAIESCGLSRARMFAAIDIAQTRAARVQKDREVGQTNMFSMFTQPSSFSKSPEGGGGEETGSADEIASLYPDVSEWFEKDRLRYEKESLGFFVSGHPLDRYQAEIKRHASATTVSVDDVKTGMMVSIAGLVSTMRERPLKSGRGRMAIIVFEDREGQVEVVCFSKAFEAYEMIIKSDEPLILTGRVRRDEGSETVKIVMSEAARLSDVRESKTEELHLKIVAADESAAQQIDALQTVLRKHPGEIPVFVHVAFGDTDETSKPKELADGAVAKLKLGERYSVTASDAMLQELGTVIAKEYVYLR